MLIGYMILGALAVGLGFYATVMIVLHARVRTKDRLESIEAISQDDYGAAAVYEKENIPFGKRIIQALGNLTVRIKIGEKKKDQQRLKLQRAGILMKPEEFTGTKIFLGAIFGILAILLTRNLVFFIAGLMLGVILPGVYVSINMKRRMQKLNDQLPEALGVVANGIRAGFSFTQAISMVVKEMEGPLVEEFSRMLRENTMGRPMDDCLTSLAARTGDEDVDILVTALLIQRQVGGSLAEILELIAETIRERVQLKGDIRTMTAQAKMAAGIVSVMPFGMAIMMNLVSPGYITPLFTSPIGIILTVAGLFFIALGIFALSKVVKVDI